MEYSLPVYALRHSSIARKLARGAPIAFVAKVHDTSVAIIEARYGRFIVNYYDDLIRATLIDTTPGSNVVSLADIFVSADLRARLTVSRLTPVFFAVAPNFCARARQDPYGSGDVDPSSHTPRCGFIVRAPAELAGDPRMFLADSALTEIITNVAGLKLELQTTMAVLGAVLAPLLRTTEPLQASLEPPSKPSRRSRVRPPLRALRASRQHRRRRAPRPSEALARARAALEANPDATLAHVAKLAKCSPSTAVNARKDLAKEARKQARKAARETPKPAPTDLRQRAQQFLKDTLAHGAKPATTVEEAAAKAHVDPRALEWARGALGIVASRANTGGAQAVQWSLPG